jgi:hypothetical protein
VHQSYTANRRVHAGRQASIMAIWHTCRNRQAKTTKKILLKLLLLPWRKDNEKGSGRKRGIQTISCQNGNYQDRFLNGRAFADLKQI